MDEQLQSTISNEIIKDNETPVRVIEKDLPYMPIEEMFNTPEYDTYIDTVDMAEMQNLNAFKSDIDKYGISAMANMAVARPTLATDTFDPVLQQTPPVIGETPGAFERMVSMSLMDIQAEATSPKEPGTTIINPVISNIRQSGFERFYHHPKYAELGFSPYANNEQYYNDNSTIWDDFARMRTQFTGLAGTGLISTYRAIGDSISGNPLAPDLKSANEMEDAMAIGNSSRGGAGSMANNFILNSAYTFGIIGSVAIEEVAMIAGTAALTASTVPTIGGTAPVAAAAALGTAARTIKNIKRVGSAIANTFAISRGAKYTYNMLRQMNRIDNARQLYSVANGTGKAVGKFFFPETVLAIKSLKTAQNGAQNLTNMAKTAKTFGGFYRDVRSFNYALAESKLESGMVYNTRISENIQTQVRENNGGHVTQDQVGLMQDNADRAGFATLLVNAPLIYLSNKIVLGTAFGGFNKSFARMANDNIKGIGRRIIRASKAVGADGKVTKAIFDKQTGKLIKGVFEDAGTGLKGLIKRTKSLGVKGNFKAFAGANLRYFAANFAEGIQEVSQEATTHGVNHYFDSIFKDPLSGGIELQNASINSAVSSQFSSQGVETFMSGFLMGGLVSGPQKLFFQGVPATYNALKGKGVFGAEGAKLIQEQKARKEELLTSVLNAYNTTWNKQADDPLSVFDPIKHNFLIQKQVAGEMNKSAYDGDQFGFIDAKDFGKFQQIYTVLSTGGAVEFENQLKDYMNLSDEDLANAFPSDKKDIKNGKLRERFQSMITQISRTEDIYNREKDNTPNPHDASQFKKGTREYQAEAIKQLSFEHIRYLKMFTKDGFDRALERTNSIYQALSSEPMFDKMSASDLTVLLDTDSIDNEMNLLKTELSLLSVDKKGNKKAIDEKQSKLDKLKAISLVLEDPKNQSENGSFDKRKISTLKTAFSDYVKFLANSSDSFVDENVIDSVLKKMVDYKALKGRAKLYAKTIEHLANPKKFDDILNRQYAIHDAAFDNIEKTYKEVIENYLKTNEINELLNQIANIDGYDVIPDPEQAKAFLLTGDVRWLKTFYIEEIGEVTKSSMPDLHKEIENLKEVYAASQSKDTNDTEESTEEDINKNIRNEIETILTDIGVEDILAPSKSKKYNELIHKVYQKYSIKQLDLGKTPVKISEWIKTNEAENFRNAFNALRNIWVANDKLINASKPLTEEEILDDNKFINWLLSPEGKEDDKVEQILEKLDVEITDITGVAESMGEEGGSSKSSENMPEPRVGKNFTIIPEANRNSDGTNGIVYVIIDNKTKKDIDLGSEIFAKYSDKHNTFDSLSEAQEVFKKIEDAFGDSNEFVFDDIELHYGMLVYSNGVEYIVLNKANSINEGKSLTLIPSDKQELSFKDKKEFLVYVAKGEFVENYTLQDIEAGLKELGPNASRLNVSEPITPYPFQNYKAGEKRAEAQARYNAILSSLSQEEANALELIILRDPEGGKDNGNYTYPGQEPNPYIKRSRSKYQIGIKVNDATQDKINKILKDLGIAKSNDQNNIFAFINVDDFSFMDTNGKPLLPINFTKAQMSNLFRTPEYLKGVLSEEQILANAQENFAANTVLSNTLDEIMSDVADGESATIPISELPNGVSFDITPGKTGHDDSVRGLNDLDHKNADNNGNYLIFKLYKLKGLQTITEVSNLEGDKRTALIEKVLADLTKQGLYDEQTGGELKNGTIDPKTGVKRNDAYKAIVLLPNGTYALVNLKAKILKPLELNIIFNEYITQAQEVISKKNEIFGGKKDDLKNIDENAKATIALREFSEEMASKKFYISTISGYNIAMQVSPWGKIELQLSKGDQRITTIRLDKGTIENKQLTNDAKIKVLIDLFNNSPQINPLGISLSNNNFRLHLDKFANIATMLSDTETNVIKEVVRPSSMSL